MTTGERINEVRNKLGISQVDFADKINVSKQTLYKYEHNIITNIPSDEIEAAAQLANVSPAYLMGWESKVEENPVETANQLSEIFLDQELMETLSIYQSLDADKKKQARDFIYFLKGRS